jgi:hypothetical protein
MNSRKPNLLRIKCFIVLVLPRRPVISLDIMDFYLELNLMKKQYSNHLVNKLGKLLSSKILLKITTSDFQVMVDTNQ